MIPSQTDKVIKCILWKKKKEKKTYEDEGGIIFSTDIVFEKKKNKYSV